MDYHPSVLLAEVRAAAARACASVPPGEGFWIVDGTLGDAGHALQLLADFPAARLFACDRDPEMLERARARLQAAAPDRFTLQLSNFEGLPDLLATQGVAAQFLLLDLGVSGVAAQFLLLDLGVSMFHFRGAARGFSYTDESLDMRLGPDSGGRTAADLLNQADERELLRIFREYGEEPLAGRFARAIVARRPIGSARDLAALCASLAPRPAGRSSYKSGKTGGRRGSSIHPATRIFQALRIAVNDELGAIERTLPRLPACLAPGGALAVISFHSLEDRLVKTALREIGTPLRPERDTERRRRYGKADPSADADFVIWTPRPIEPGADEIEANPASRSARLRVLARNVR